MRIGFAKSDGIGIMAGSLCLIHCIATPFIFIAKTCTESCCAHAPDWWQWVDVLFLLISLIAVYHSSKKISGRLLKAAMWISWAVLSILIANEQIHLFETFDSAKYASAISLMSLHFYNMKYCGCGDDEASCITG